MQPLFVLLWKNLMVTKRRPISFVFQMVYPLIFIGLLFYMRAALKPKETNLRSSENSMIRFTEEKFPEVTATLPRCLLYTPNSELAGILMDEIGDQLGLTRLTEMPNPELVFQPCNGYYPFSNYHEIADYVNKFHTNEAIIVFEDMDAESWTARRRDRLTYTIRMRDIFNTHAFTSTSENVPQYHPEYGDAYEGFMRIQWAIDTSYIKLRTGNSVSQKLSVQEFPYYRRSYEQAVSVFIISALVFACCWIGVLNLFSHVMTRMMTDRATGIQELIKLNGVSGFTLGMSYFLSALPPAVVFAVGSTILLKVGEKPLIDLTGGGIILFALALYVVSVIACAMAFSYVAHSYQYATMISFFAFLFTVLVAKLVANNRPSASLLLLASGLLLHNPLSWIFTDIAYFEALDLSLSFDDLTATPNDLLGSVMDGYICMVLQILLFFALAWYLSNVRQGKYGNSLPWNFLCTRSFWGRDDIEPYVSKADRTDLKRESKYFEKPPANKEAGIKIVNVSKSYPKHKVLRNVSLDVYKGEITVLLGHNGAGKTTLMSIISGMIPASQGRVYVNGADSALHGVRVRREIGLCPQHNLFIPDLNVIEQVMFFTMIKEGSSHSEARQSSMDLLDDLCLGEKALYRPEALSGGMKRRLQLACALAGGSDVLVLDEPTSGLDVETRRELWDLLLSLRGDRTVLLSTHFMEEADALGDRVAALHTGHLRCHATPMFLKKAMGTGYRLSITTSGAPKEEEITRVITEHVSEATLKEESFKTLTYNLPASATPKFPAMFAALEKDGLGPKRKSVLQKSKRGDLGIETIGLGVSTLEEAFIILCSDTDPFSEDELKDIKERGPDYGKVKGIMLYWRQVMALIKRHINFIKAGFFMFFLMNVLIPGMLMYWFSTTINNIKGDTKSSEPDLTLNLNIYKPLPERRVFMDVKTSGATRRFKNKLVNVMFAESTNITRDIVKVAVNNTIEYNKYLVGIELDDQRAKAYYTTVYRHAAPVAVNLLSNMIASQYLPSAGPRAITLHNHPLRGPQPSALAETVKDTTNCFMWAMLVVCITLFAVSNFYALPSREGASGVRHMYVMAGCPAALFWLTTLFFHTLLTALIMIPITVVCAYFADENNTFGEPVLLVVLSAVIVLGSMAFLSLLYVLCVCFSERTANILATFIILAFGFITPLIKLGIDLFDEDVGIAYIIMLEIVNYVMPPQTMTIAASKVTYVGRLNKLCEVSRDDCPALLIKDHGFDADRCCAGEQAMDYLSFEQFSPLLEMLIMMVQTVVYMTIVILVQFGFFNCLCERLRNRNFVKDNPVHSDEIVADEADYVNSEIKMSKGLIAVNDESMLVSDLHKNYRSCRRSMYAVKGINFSVAKGECFGLLGTNGAGKSTTFKMLTTEVCPTRGRIYANGYFMDEEKRKYLRTIAYCPQFSGIDEFQTANNNLRTVMVIRGLDDKDIKSELKAWTDVVGLQQYKDRRASQYSGGYKRRLGTAVALCSGAPLSLLDEPTAGVDVGARRRVHAALRKSLRHDRSIVITSHSMDEMESLCARIAIMVGGTIRALGTPAELRARHALGYAVIFKVSSFLSESEKSNEDKVDELKLAMLKKFDCQLKDEHMTMLHYHISDKICYSDLFTELEEIRKNFPKLIEDYSVSETTLEEVFLHFAREKKGRGDGREDDDDDEEEGKTKKKDKK